MKACRTVATAIGVLVLGAMAGCATVSQESVELADVVVVVDASRQVWFNGDAYAIPDLPAALKAVRVARNQPIRIQFPNRKDKDLFVQLSSVLRTAGFTRFFFVSDQHAEAAVSDPGRPAKKTFEPINPFSDTPSPAPTATPPRNRPAKAR